MKPRGARTETTRRTTTNNPTTELASRVVLGRKPGALAGATALAAARADGGFTAGHQLFSGAARRALGDGPGTRALVGVLLGHRTLPASAVLTGMTAALAVGRHDPDLVAVEA